MSNGNCIFYSIEILKLCNLWVYVIKKNIIPPFDRSSSLAKTYSYPFSMFLTSCSISTKRNLFTGLDHTIVECLCSCLHKYPPLNSRRINKRESITLPYPYCIYLLNNNILCDPPLIPSSRNALSQYCSVVVSELSVLLLYYALSSLHI